jgi:hypothetical protein
VGPYARCQLLFAHPDHKPTALQPEGNEHPLKFSHVFHLMPVNNSFVVTNGELFWEGLGSMCGTTAACKHARQYVPCAVSCAHTCPVSACLRFYH